MTDRSVYPRPLTAQERDLTSWLLTHGQRSSEELLEQLDSAVISGKCPCGCASFDLVVNGVEATTTPGLYVVADFLWDDPNAHEMGVFAFTKGGILAGVEITDYTGCGNDRMLPVPSMLRPTNTNL